MTIEMEQFYSGKNEDGAVWFEPVINGRGIGLEMLLHGPDSNTAFKAEDRYRKMRDISSRIKDESLRNEFIQRAIAERYTDCISDIRGKDGAAILVHGKRISIKDISEILFKSPSILKSIDIYYRTFTKSFEIDEVNLEAAVRNYFYLNYQYAEHTTITNPKTKKKEIKTKYVRNIDKREDFIKKFKQEAFDEICATDMDWAKLKDIPIPDGCSWLFGHFLEIWYMSGYDFGGNKLFSPKDIIDYCECFGVDISYKDRKLLMRMKGWAMSEINLLNEKNDKN